MSRRCGFRKVKGRSEHLIQCADYRENPRLGIHCPSYDLKEQLRRAAIPRRLRRDIMSGKYQPPLVNAILVDEVPDD